MTNENPTDCFLVDAYKKPVLRIHLNLMRIRILYPHWKKWIQIRIRIMIQVISKRFTDFFLTKNNYKFFFSLIFILKLYESFRNAEIFIISLFFKSSDLGFRSKKVFFYPLDPDPGSQKSCGSNVSRILSTEKNDNFIFNFHCFLTDAKYCYYQSIFVEAKKNILIPFLKVRF